jgi:hypothetical protein
LFTNVGSEKAIRQININRNIKILHPKETQLCSATRKYNKKSVGIGKDERERVTTVCWALKGMNRSWAPEHSLYSRLKVCLCKAEKELSIRTN